MDIHSGGADDKGVPARKRTRMVRPYPIHTLQEGLVVASTIQQKNAGLPLDRVLLAKALGTTPASSGFTMKLSSSAKYGLTDGGYNDKHIALTPRGESVVAPKGNSERREALLEAAFQPELFRRLYELLDGKRVPEEAHLQNMLERELGVSAGLTEECMRIVLANGVLVGVLGDVGGSMYVSLSGAHLAEDQPDQPESQVPAPGPTLASTDTPKIPDADPAASGREGKIFIGHAGSHDVVDFLKTILDEFGIPYGIAEGDYDDPRPVTAEVSQEMRECSAAVLVFARPSWSVVRGGREVSTTDTMRYQLGAASVLYGESIILLTEIGEDQADLDTGLHTLQFERDRLGEVTLALLSELHRMDVIEVRTRPRPLSAPATA